MAEIKVQYENLAELLSEMNALDADTGYSIYATADLINSSSGQTTAETNEVFRQLMEIEKVMQSIISKTRKVLANAGFDFQADEVIAQELYEQVKISATK